jgi:hypothetical protein
VSRKPTGSSITPNAALAQARQLIKTVGFEVGHPKLERELLDLGYSGYEELRAVIAAALDEIQPESYTPVQNPDRVPGLAFVWDSPLFRKRMYLKFKIISLGRNKQKLVMYSCHKPIH